MSEEERFGDVAARRDARSPRHKSAELPVDVMVGGR